MVASHPIPAKAGIRGKLAIAFLFTLSAATLATAQDIPIGATYICSGEHIYVENCNMRDLSDKANCMVAHPDKLLPNGMNSYTYVPRGDLRKLLPTCTQPSAKQLAAAAAFQKKQQDTYNANAQKAEDQLKAATQPAPSGQPQKPVSAEDRAIRRCVTSGRLPASCTGNALLGAFGQMLSQVLPGADKNPASGPSMAGVFRGQANGVSISSTAECWSTAPSSRPTRRPTPSTSKAVGQRSLLPPLRGLSSSPSTPMEPSPAPAPLPSTASSPTAM